MNKEELERMVFELQEKDKINSAVIIIQQNHIRNQEYQIKKSYDDFDFAMFLLWILVITLFLLGLFLIFLREILVFIENLNTKIWKIIKKR
jgi:hypothetical protein